MSLASSYLGAAGGGGSLQRSPDPDAKGPSQEWSRAYVKSLSGKLKIVEMVGSSAEYMDDVIVA